MSNKQRRRERVGDSKGRKRKNQNEVSSHLTSVFPFLFKVVKGSLG